MTGPRIYGLIVLGVVLVLVIAVMFFLDPLRMLRGWLAAFVWSSMIPTGSLLLLLIHRLTGGAWGQVLGPLLETAARATLLVIFASLPVVMFSAQIYHWNDPALPRAIARFYMNAPLFGLRTLAALAIWTLLAWVPGLRNTPARAAASLLVLAVITNIIPVDWVISTEPGFTSSAFGFGFAIEQMLASLALCAIVADEGSTRENCRDLAALIIATLLGVVYFLYMQFVIIWYGNLPEKTRWYVIRGVFPWPWIGGFAFAIGAAFPFLALLNQEMRESPKALRIVGTLISGAIVLHMVWLVIPNLDAGALLPALVASALFALALTFWIVQVAKEDRQWQLHTKTVVRHG